MTYEVFEERPEIKKVETLLDTVCCPRRGGTTSPGLLASLHDIYRKEKIKILKPNTII